MINRYTVECPGCSAKIVLRISIGLDIEQPFYYVCERCGAATRGKQLIWYKPLPGARLELEAGRIVTASESPDQIITIHPDLPARAAAREMADDGGSPFIMNFQILGDKYVEFDTRLKTFRMVADRDWVNLQRWMGYYLNRNWEQFDREGQRIHEENWSTPEHEWQRHDMIHRMLDLMTASLWVHPYYPEMKADWVRVLNLAIAKSDVLKNYVNELARSEELRRSQRDIFHAFELFMDNRSGILPGLAAEMYPAGAELAIQELRLFRDEFPQLRDFYIVAFEECHHILKYIMGMINIAERGDPRDFGPNAPKSMAAFERLPNAEKINYLRSLQAWAINWDKIFDRKIRNAIGHHSVRHDLPTGMLVLRDGTQIPYLEFVMKTLRLIQPILVSANVIKSVYIHDLMFENEGII